MIGLNCMKEFVGSMSFMLQWLSRVALFSGDNGVREQVQVINNEIMKSVLGDKHRVIGLTPGSEPFPTLPGIAAPLTYLKIHGDTIPSLNAITTTKQGQWLKKSLKRTFVKYIRRICICICIYMQMRKVIVTKVTFHNM